MYLSYEEYLRYSQGEHLPEVDFTSAAPFADLVIDNWTMDRVKKAVSNGEDLPDSVKVAYASIVNNIEALEGITEPVSSFSNGVDSYTFASTSDQAESVKQWALNLLPVEWCSGIVSFEGGNRYAC